MEQASPNRPAPFISRVVIDWPFLLLPGGSGYPQAARIALALIFWAAVILWIASWAFMTTVPIHDDENFYVRAAKSIATMLHAGAIDPKSLGNVVGNAWFMPGVPILLQPLFLIVPDPSLPAIRAYVSIANFLLWIVCIRDVYRIMGRWYAAVLVAFPPLVISWQFFSACVFGDVPAGLLMAVAFARTWSLARQAFRDEIPSWCDILVFELLLSLSVYLRGSALVLVLAIHVFLLALWVISGRWRRLLPLGTRLAAGGLLFVATILPWSFTASHLIKDSVFTTSSLRLSLGYTFGNRDELCFGFCNPKVPVFIAAQRFSRVYADRNDLPILDVQKQMSDYALKDTTLRQYLLQVRNNFITFAGFPEWNTFRFVRISTLGLQRYGEMRLLGISRILVRTPYYPLLVCLVLVNFLPFWRTIDDQLKSLAFKMFTLCIFIQPFVHTSHTRYWPVFAPLMGLAGVFLAMQVGGYLARRKNPAAAAGTPAEPIWPARILLALQLLYIAAAALAMGAIALV